MEGSSPVARFHVPLYHRKGNERTQTDADADRIAASGELWGGVPRYGHTQPVVQAWRGPLPEGSWGIEFATAVPPDPDTPPQRCEWRGPRPGVEVFVDDAGVPWAKIPVQVTKIVRREAAR
jgi:hypothetical protein